MKAREGECKTVKSNQRTLCKRGVIRACDLPVEVEAEVEGGEVVEGGHQQRLNLVLGSFLKICCIL